MKTIGIIQNVHQCVYQHFWNFEYTRKMAELEGGYFSPELNGHPVYDKFLWFPSYLQIFFKV